MAKAYDLRHENELLRKRVAELEAQLRFNMHGRELTEHMLGESNARFRVLFETMALGVIYQDADGVVMLANPAVERILGLDWEKIVGQTSFGPHGHFIHEDGAEVLVAEQPAMLALHTGKPINDIVMGVFHPQENDYHWVIVSAVPEFRTNETQPYRVYTTFTDITAQKRADAALRESENKFSKVFNENPTAMMLLDIATRTFLAVNQAYCKTLGYSKEEVVNIPGKVGFSADPEQLKAAVQILEETNHLSNFELNITNKSGEKIVGLVFAEPVELNNRQLHILSFINITERKKAEENLRESEFRYHHVLDTMMEGCQIIDFDWRYIYVNETLAQQGQCQREDLLGHTMMAMYPGIDQTPLFETLQDCMENRVAKRLENMFTFPNGSQGWYDLSIQPIEQGLFILSVDITERKRADALIQNRNQMLLALQRVALEIGTELSLPTLLQSILEQAQSLQDADRGGGVYFFEPDEHVLRLAHGSGINQGRDGITVQIGEGVAGRVYETSQPLIIDDYAHWEGHATILAADPPSTVMGVPLFLDEKVIGVLTLIADSSKRKFTGQDLQQAEMFAAQASIAIKNAQLYQQAGLEIKERKQVEGALRASEERYRTVADFNYDWEYWVDPNRQFTYISPSCERLTGYRPDEFQADSHLLEAIVYLDDLPSLHNHMALEFEQKEATAIDFRIITAGGEIRWINHVCQAVYGTDGRWLGRRASNRDITERKQAEQKILELQEFARATIDALSAHICVLDENGVIISVNRAWREFADANPPTPAEYALGENYLAVCDRAIGPDAAEAAAVAQGIRAVMNGASNHFQMEYPCHSSQEKRWFTVKVTRFVQHDSLRVVIAHENITERKQAEEALRLSEARFVTIFKANPAALAISQLDSGKLIDVNDAWLELTGYTRPEVIDHTPLELNLWVNPEQRAQMVKTVQDTGKARIDMQFRQKSGEVRDLLMSAELVELIEKSYLITMAQDITERKRAEDALIQSNERFTQLVNNISEVFWIVDLTAGKNIYVSPAFESVVGLSHESVEQLADGYLSLVLPEDRHILLESYRQEEMGFKTSIQYRIRRPDGSIRWIRDKGSPVLNSEGKVVRVVGIARDLTDQVEAEIRLKESEARFRRLAENIHEVFWMFDRASGQFSYVSPAYETIWGYSLESLHQDAERYLESVLPEDRPILLTAVEKQNRGELTDTEYRINHANGSVRWVWNRSFPVFDDDGKLVSIAGIATDVTDRKQAESEVLRRQELLEMVIVLGKNITAITDLPQCLREIHESVRLGLGFDRVGLFLYDPIRNLVSGVYGTSRTGQMEENSWYRLPVEQWTDWQIALQSPIGISIDDDYQANHHPEPDDEMYGVKQHITLAAWAGGKPVALITVDNLISQKEITSSDLEALQLFAGYAGLAIENARLQTGLEQRVKERTAEVRDLYDNAPNGYHSLDRNGTFVMINQTELDWLGYTREELLGRMKLTDILTPEGAQQFQEKFPTFVKQGWIKDVEYDLVRKDGSLMPVILGATAIYDEAGNYISNRVTVFDNTERKRTDQRLRESEARLDFLISKTPAIIFTAALSAGVPITFISASVRDVLGYEPARYLEDPGFWTSVIHPDDVVVSERAAQEMLDKGHAVWDSRIKCADGVYRWMSTGTSLVFDENGQPLEIIGYSVNIENQMRAQQALLESEETYRALFETANDAIFLLDIQSMAYIRVNSRCPELLGVATSEELLGKHAYEFVDPTEVEDAEERLKALLSGERIPPYERKFRRQDGKLVDTEINLSLIRDGQGRPKLIQSVVRDITQRKQAERAILESEAQMRVNRDQLSAANAALEKAARMKDDFLASMSHELRTPLTGILGLSEALQFKTYGELSEKQLKALKSIEGSGRHLLELINDILDLSKIEAGKLEMQIEPCSLSDICQASLQMIKGMAQQKNQNVSFAANPVATIVRADPRRLKQMLVNLLSNAVKFTPVGGSLGLEVQGFVEKQVICLTVWDKGIGIKAEDMPRLFQPFVQLDSSLARQQSGTGLGLSLVQRMAEMHGGSMDVESIPNEGSRFTIVLPWSPEKTQPMPRQQRDTGRFHHSLTVEDGELDAEQINRYLRHMGIENIILPFGRNAVQMAVEGNPGVILLDLHLPDMSGWDVLAALKADERTRSIPVVISSVEENRSKALAMGAAGYMVKPFTLIDLRNELSRVANDTTRPETVMMISPRHTAPLVLLVDDNEIILETFSDFLGTKNFRIISARGGVEALDLAPKIHPDILIIDIQMPGMDGLEVARTIRAHPDGLVADIPIIAVTALAMPGDRERCLAAGANAYMSKPVHLPELVDTIRELLRASKDMKNAQK